MYMYVYVCICMYMYVYVLCTHNNVYMCTKYMHTHTVLCLSMRRCCVHSHMRVRMCTWVRACCMRGHEGRCGCVGKGAGARGWVGACMLNACAGRCADAGACCVNRSRGPLPGAHAFPMVLGTQVVTCNWGWRATQVGIDLYEPGPNRTKSGRSPRADGQ